MSPFAFTFYMHLYSLLLWSICTQAQSKDFVPMRVLGIQKCNIHSNFPLPLIGNPMFQQRKPDSHYPQYIYFVLKPSIWRHVIFEKSYISIYSVIFVRGSFCHYPSCYSEMGLFVYFFFFCWWWFNHFALIIRYESEKHKLHQVTQQRQFSAGCWWTGAGLLNENRKER